MVGKDTHGIKNEKGWALSVRVLGGEARCCVYPGCLLRRAGALWAGLSVRNLAWIIPWVERLSAIYSLFLLSGARLTRPDPLDHLYFGGE